MGSLSFFTQHTSGTLNAIEMLKADHARVQELFRVFKEAESSDDEEMMIDIVTTACLELKVHSRMEQEIFYPAVLAKADEQIEDLLTQSEVEHQTVDYLVEKIASQQLDKSHYRASFKVIAEYVEHHAREEEQILFPKVEALDLDLAALGRKMRTRQLTSLEEIICSDIDLKPLNIGGEPSMGGSQNSSPQREDPRRRM